MKSRIARYLFLLVLLFPILPLHAQLTTATIVGSVLDASGASIGGAAVTATNAETHFTRTVNTGSAGNYRLDFLPVGTYAVRVEAQGFAAFEKPAIVLTLNAEVRLDANMSVTGTTQTVEVTADAPLVETTSSSLGRTVTNEEVDNLPIVNRNVYDLLTLTPGVQSSSNINTLGYPQQVVYINGGTDNFVGSVSYYLDGGLNMTFIRNSGNILPNPDALREFNVQTNNYNALYGRMSSGLVNVVTKSGTNRVHGSVFEFFRSDKLNATPAFSVNGKSPLHRNQFGATLGGPILHDRTFFFGSYAGLRQTTASLLNSAIVPTPAQRLGDFSANVPTTSGAITSCTQTLSAADKAAGNFILCDRLTNPAKPVPYSRNVIPSGQLDPTAQNIITRNIPLADNGNLWQGYSVSPLNTDEFLIKIDHNLGQKHRIEAMYFNTSGNQSQSPGGNLNWSRQNFTWRQQNANLSDTWTVSPNAVNQIWANYTRMLSGRVNTPGTSLSDYGSSFFTQGAPMLPQITVTNYFTLAQAISGPKTGTNFYSLRDVYSLTRGKHTLSVGAEGSLNKDVQYTYLNNYGVFSFTSSTSSRTGNALADFVLGQPNTMNQDSPVNAADNSWFYGIFAQDDYTVRSNLTLNLGVRLDIQTPPVDPLNREATFIQGQQSTVYPTAPLGVLIAGDTGVDRGIVSTRYHHVSPRVGFAWDPYGHGRTAVRGAFGLFFGSVSGNEWNGVSNFQPFAVRNRYSNITSLTNIYGDKRSFPNGNPYPYLYTPNAPKPFILPATIEGIDKNYQWPYTYQTNFSVQQQLTHDLAMTISYVGSFSHDVPFAPDVNYPLYASAASPINGVTSSTTNNFDARRPIQPGILSTVSVIQSRQRAHYHGLQVTAEKRMSNALSVKAFYTWSKTLTTASVNNPGAVLGSAEDFNRLDLEYGRGDFDVRNQANVAVVWKPIFFKSAPLFTRAVINGWTLSGIAYLQSGSPFTVTTGVDNNLDGNTNDRANPTGITYFTNAGHARSAQIAQYFNTASFCSYTIGSTSCPAGTGPGGLDGTTRRNDYTGPGYRNVNAALFRDFKVHEGFAIQGRAEVTNVFNLVNLNNPNSSLNSSNFGRITSAGAMRQIQLGARILF